MKSHKPLLIANWKTALTYADTIKWIIRHTGDLIAWQKNFELILCPEQISMVPVRNLTPNSITIGAQNCSPARPGRNTGQVSAQSLYEAQITHCIINHSELSVSQQDIIAQLRELENFAITPILCVSSADKLAALISAYNLPAATIIALEPLHAVGGSAAAPKYIAEETTRIKNLLSPSPSTRIIYGGGVTAEECREIFKTARIDGFLIGRASSDFQALEKIVSSLLEETNTQEKCI